MFRQIVLVGAVLLAAVSSSTADSELKEAWKAVTEEYGEWGYGHLHERRGQICDVYRQWGQTEVPEDVWPGCTVLFIADPEDYYDLGTVAEGEQDNFLNTQHYNAAWNLHGKGFLGNSLPRPYKDIDPVCVIANVDGHLVMGYEEGEGDKLLPCPGHDEGAPFPQEWILEALNGTRDAEEMCSQCYQSVCTGDRSVRARDCGNSGDGGVDLEDEATFVKQAQPVYHCHMTMADEGACDYVQYDQHEDSRTYYMDYSVTCGWQHIQHLNITFCDCTKEAGTNNNCRRHEAMEMAYAGVVCGNCNNGFNEDRAFASIFSPRSDDEPYHGRCAEYRTAEEGWGKNFSKMMCSKGIWCPEGYNGGDNCKFHCDHFGAGSEVYVDPSCGDYPDFPTELCTEEGTCLYVPDSEKSWERAEAACAEMGAHLAAVHSEDDNSLVRRLAINAGAEEVWIGFNDKVSEGTFVWSDGTSGDYTAWADGEPNDSNGEDCTELTKATGRWNDQSCGDSRAFVCAKTGSFSGARRLLAAGHPASGSDAGPLPTVREVTLDTRFDWGHVITDVRARGFKAAQREA